MNAQERLIEAMGLISQEHGGPRIAGRIVGLLLLEGRPLSLGQISERLEVSRASVSTNARELAKRGTLRLTSRSGDRQNYYELVVGPYFEMLDELGRQFRRHAEVIADCARDFEQTPNVAARVSELSEFFEKSSEILVNWAGALRQETLPGKDQQ